MVWRSLNWLADSVVLPVFSSAAKSVKSLAIPASVTVPFTDAAAMSAWITGSWSEPIHEGFPDPALAGAPALAARGVSSMLSVAPDRAAVPLVWAATPEPAAHRRQRCRKP